MACSGHTACPGHRRGLGTERDVQVTDGYLGHGVCVHLPTWILKLKLEEAVLNIHDVTLNSCLSQAEHIYVNFLLE